MNTRNKVIEILKTGHLMNVGTVDDDSWYKLTPTKIELIDEEHFGFDKKQLDLS